MNVITGCRENDCYHRMGGQWITQRLSREREPRLRGRIERERGRIRQFWASSADSEALSLELESFRAGLRSLTPEQTQEGHESKQKTDHSAIDG